ncbi:hypothetical protein DAPPUDRAFT_306489 [Daphnia pulex]|uniref:RING-type domain-containing protein n=1 Tax=Daphnia pulex TaxID=6669 RepID=E9FYA4_DAPPU|nr:hypothetical protein DAPPUDRAFT_306489 [Daphnia pulex]|eukprot:EFX87807.1 hypothetical protein DAPPUDRAFT_306489 [Daphnia pulex]
MAFVDDLARIREVLQANAVDKFVAEDMLVALLELYASDNQRVDLVVLDLQAMLGKELSAGNHFTMQQQRWAELQRPPEPRNSDVIIARTNVPRTTIAAEVVVMDQNRPSTSGNAVALPTVVNRNKRPISEVSKESSVAKKVTPTKVENDPRRPPVIVATVDRVRPASEINQVAPTRRPVASGSTAQGSIRTNHAGTSSQTIHVLNNKATTATVISAPTSGPSKNETIPKENLEETSMKFHKATLSAVQDINVKFSAYKATEFVELRKSSAILDEYIGMIVTDANLAIPKVDVLWNPPVEMNPEHQRLFQHVYESFISEKVEFLVRAVPDADPDFLEERVNSFQGDQEKIRGFLTEILEGNMQFPTRADYNRRKEYNVLANKFFTVEEFLELYDDPQKYFTEDTRVTDVAYRDQAINQLKKDFKFASLLNIRRLFNINNHHYTPTYFDLIKNPTFNQRKTKRSAHECLGTAKDLFLIQEIAFVGLLPDIDLYLRNKEKMRKDAITLSRTTGTLLDCPICCEDELIGLDLIYCPQGHGEVLKKSIFGCLEKRRQAEEVLAAGIEGIESCPFCEYSVVPGYDDRLFTCRNPECLKISCRQCREVNHSPLRCEEYAMKQRLNNYVETKMTEALVRQCPSCKKNFVKADGCNKMVCPCGAIMCYICRQQIKDYNHFSNLPPNQPNQPAPIKPPNAKCPLYSDTLKMHEEEVAISAAKARAELASSNPNIRIDLVLGKK